MISENFYFSFVFFSETFSVFILCPSVSSYTKYKKRIFLHQKNFYTLVYFESRVNVKMYMTDFFIRSINYPQCTDKYGKKLFDSDFPAPCFDVPKMWNFTSVGVQNRETQNRRLGMIETSFQGFKLRRKQISQSFSYYELINSPGSGAKVRCW